MLFPTLGLTGLLCTIALIELATRRAEVLLLVAVLAFFTSRYQPQPNRISWAGLNTRFGDVFAGDDPLAVMDAVAREARENPAVVQVWPESIVPHWNQSTEAFGPRSSPTQSNAGRLSFRLYDWDSRSVPLALA
ncbi:MAG: hypothetical protein WKF37_07645 [Bryobacteraceae bacterium]